MIDWRLRNRWEARFRFLKGKVFLSTGIGTAPLLSGNSKSPHWPQLNVVAVSEGAGLTRFGFEHLAVKDQHLGEVEPAGEDHADDDQVGDQCICR